MKTKKEKKRKWKSHREAMLENWHKAQRSRWHIWHNTRMMANQYFICKGYDMKWQIPRWLGRIVPRRWKIEGG